MADQWRDDEPIDEVIARVRVELGKSQLTLAEDIARVSGDPRVTREYVSRWENRKRIPTPYWREHLGQVLGIPRDVLDRAAAVARMRRAVDQPPKVIAMAPVMATTPSNDSSRTLEETLDLWDELMRRRNFLGGAGSIAATTLLSGGTPAAAASLPAVADKAELFDTCARLTASYRRLNQLLGHSAVYGQVMDHHGILSAWFERAAHHADRQRLGELVTDSGDLAAWLCFDLERYEEAAVLYRQAAGAAKELGDVSRQAYLVGRMSRTLSSSGRLDKALLLADGAERIAHTKATLTVRSWRAATRSYAHAEQGDERACRANMERAAGLLDRANGEPRDGYIAFYGEAHLHKWSGYALLKLAETKDASIGEARSAMDRALDAWPESNVLDSAEVFTAGASARLAQGDISETARLTGRAFDVAAKTRSPRLLRHVSDLRARMRPYRHTRAVRELDERLLTRR